ncbi:retrovirus-related pol polyprotein from transposon TNT 1-94 [Tanacetum coccineum]
MLLAIKDEAGSNLKYKENYFMLDNSYRDETLEELTTAIIMMSRIQPADDNGVQKPDYDAKAVSELEREIRADKDTIERILKERDKTEIDVFKIENEKIIIQHETQLAKKVFKERENRYLEDISMLGYKNLKRLKKAIAAQPKMYHGEMLHSANLKIDSPDSEETLEDAEESRLKMRNKMVQLNYGKLNALYETFVPQQEPSVEQTYFSFPSTSNDCSESKEVTSDLPIPKMPKENRKQRWMSDSQNSLREFYKTDVISMSGSLSENLKELQQELIEEKNKLLQTELKKSSNDSKDIQANLLKRIKILENDFKRSQAQSIDFELQLQHQKEKMACDVSWKSRLSKLNDENVLLKTQVNFVVQERENIKLEYQTLFNSIKATRAQHQQEFKELVENISPKTYAYGDVRSKNQDLLMVISELKEKLKSFEKRKDVNTKFDKSVTSGKTLYVTPLSHNIAVKAKKVSNPEDNTDRLKPVTSYSIPKSEQKQKKNANVPTRGMYKIQKQELHTRDYKTNMNVSNSTRVGSSNSVRRPKSKDTKSKNRVLKNTNAKSSSAYVRKTSSNVRIDSNKCETKNSNECQSNASVLNTKAVNAVNDGSNLVCVSCGKDVFLLSHGKCVARYALSRDSKVTRSLFTTPIAAKSKNLGATSVVAKSRFSVAKTQQQQIRILVIQLVIFHFGNDHFAAITGYGDYVQGNLTICHGDDLLTGSRESNLYTISISELAASSPMCLMSRATSTKSWLLHRMLSHLNFGSINQLTSKDLVDGLLKFIVDGLTKLSMIKITYVHHVESINGEKYILVIIDDHSRYTCAQILKIRTDNGTDFKNEKLRPFYAKLVEAARTMLFFKTPKSVWAESIATACFTQNRSLVHTRYNKTHYELIQGRKPNVQYFHVFGSLCYITNDRDDLGKMKLKAYTGIFISYAESSRGFRIYNRQTKKIMETIHARVEYLFKDRSEVRVSPVESSRRRHSQDCIQDSIRSL